MKTHFNIQILIKRYKHLFDCRSIFAPPVALTNESTFNQDRQMPFIANKADGIFYVFLLFNNINNFYTYKNYILFNEYLIITNLKEFEALHMK